MRSAGGVGESVEERGLGFLSVRRGFMGRLCGSEMCELRLGRYSLVAAPAEVGVKVEELERQMVMERGLVHSRETVREAAVFILRVVRECGGEWGVRS